MRPRLIAVDDNPVTQIIISAKDASMRPRLIAVDDKPAPRWCDCDCRLQ